MQSTIILFCLASFLLATIHLLVSFRQFSKKHFFRKLGIISFAAGLIALTYLVGFSGLTTTGFMLGVGLGWLSFLLWLVWGVDQVGAFTSPIIAIILILETFASQNPGSDMLPPGSLLVRVHILTAVIGQALVIIACAVALLLLWQHRLLKQKLLEVLPENFPAIGRLTQGLDAMVWGGFGMITLSLLSGAALVLQYNIASTHNVGPKIIWALIVWGWYLAVLVLRMILNYTATKMARMCLVGFLFLALTYFGIPFFRGSGGF